MEEQHHDDQSHYEISLTAGQAFVAFVLLLLSIAASFAFGMMIGRGQGDERLVVRKETPVITEASVLPKKSAGKIVELGVADDDFVADQREPAPAAIEERTAGGAAAEPAPVATPAEAPVTAAGPTAERRDAAEPAVASGKVPHYAQLFSSGDQKAAEALAARLIDGGFTTAYVERGANDRGPIFRVRVKFPSEPEARAAEGKLREFSREVWITSK